mgnify:CR=1 FL=1
MNDTKLKAKISVFVTFLVVLDQLSKYVANACLKGKNDFIIIKDYGQKIYVIDNIRNAEPTQMTELGNASLRYDLDGEEGEYGLYIEDEQVMLGNSLDNTAIQIDVYRNDTKIDSVRFASSTLDDITEEIKLTAVR